MQMIKKILGNHKKKSIKKSGKGKKADNSKGNAKADKSSTESTITRQHSGAISHVSKLSGIELIKKELGYVALSFVLVFVFLKILYYLESFVSVFVLCLGLYYLFLIPGYILIIGFRDKVPVAARLVLGFGIGLGITTTIPYYLDMLFKVPVFPYSMYYPALIILIGAFLFCRKNSIKIKIG